MADQSDGGTARSARMPVVFVGHGTPMNAIEENAFSASWQKLGRMLPRPDAVLCVSAHWEAAGTRVTAMEKPRTIHDFGGFPQELYRVQYPASGCRWMVESLTESGQAMPDHSWGLDHGCWCVLRHMYPEADVPVIQLSLDTALSPKEHYALARSLSAFRRRNVLVLGSGNMVHNLWRLAFQNGDAAFGFDWALEANGLFKKRIDEGRHDELMNYQALGEAVRLAVPTPEHYLPMLYALALKEPDEAVSYFNDVPWAGSLTMTSFVVQ